MGRPPLGPVKKSKRVPLNVTEAQYAQIQARGGTEWVRRIVLAALTPSRAADPVQKTAAKPKTKPPEPTAAPQNTPHRHKRVRVGPKFVGGQDVGEWRCSDPDCGVTLGVFQ